MIVIGGGGRARASVRRALAAMVAGAALVPPLAAQMPDSARKPAARIIGVYDSRTGTPLPGVQVRDAFSGTYALTSATGTVSLTFLTIRGAAALIELRKLGYQPKQLVISGADSTPITELLDPVVMLGAVVTTAKYQIDRDAGTWAGFEQRCQSNSATCIRAADLNARPSANLADFLLRARGVTMGTCAQGRSAQCGKIAMRSATIPPSLCQPTFFVDGYEWNSSAGAPADLTPGTPPQAPYVPANVKAIEVYPTERTRPLRFEGNPQCGVVVIWTK
jgi:hypothetical protein